MLSESEINGAQNRDIWPFSKPASAIQTTAAFDMLHLLFAGIENAVFYFELGVVTLLQWMLGGLVFLWPLAIFITQLRPKKQAKMTSMVRFYIFLRTLVLLYSLCRHYSLFSALSHDHTCSLIAFGGVVLAGLGLSLTSVFFNASCLCDLEGRAAEFNIDLAEIAIYQKEQGFPIN